MRPLTGSTETWAKQERPDSRPLWFRTRRLFLVGATRGTLFHSLIPLIIATITTAASASIAEKNEIGSGTFSRNMGLWLISAGMNTIFRFKRWKGSGM